VRGLWTRRGLAWLAEQVLSEFESLGRELLVSELSDIGGRIARVEVALKARAASVPGVGLLMTMPGVGIRTAEAVVAYMDNADRFRRNKSVGCYFGMVPSEDTSVKSRFGHITREGPAIVRRLVTEATWQAIRRDATLKAYYEKVCRGDSNRRKIALIATAHHMLRVMHAMLTSGEAWRSAA
jgi:transposase